MSLSRPALVALVILTACANAHAQRLGTPLVQQVATSAADFRFRELESQLAALQTQLDGMSHSDEAPGVDLQLRECPAWNFSVDWLHWRPRRRGLDFAIVDALNGEGPVGPVQDVEFDYDNGVRARLGFTNARGWEVAVAYTTFHTNSELASAVAPPGLGVLKKTTGFADLAGGEVAERATASADLELELADLELGTWLLASPCLSIRGFGSLRYAHLQQSFTAHFDGFQYNNGLVEQLQEMEGIGLRGGAESRLALPRGFGLFGSGAASVMAGFFETNLRDTDNNGALVVGDVSDGYAKAVVILEASAGLTWSHGPIEVAGGYEFAAWLNAVDTSRFPDSFNESYYSPSNDDLLLDGFFARVTLTR